MRLVSIAAMLSGILLPLSAMAQDAPSPPSQPPTTRPPTTRPSLPRPNNPRPGPAVTMSAEQFNTLTRQRMQDQVLRRQSRWAASVPQERRDRAARLAAMANGGQCPEAIRIAVAEGDRDMANSLFEACRRPQVTVSQPAVVGD